MKKGNKKNKLGLCLGGGGARGYAVYPIIKKFEELNLKFDYVSGCSVGSVIGAYYCLYGEVDSLYEKLVSLSGRDWANLISLNNPKKAFLKMRKIRKFFVDNFFGAKTFKDLKIPLVVVATNLNTKRAEYFSKGLLIDAVMASVSIPGVFKPYKIKSKSYVDGGIKDNLPVDILFEKGMNKVIGVDVNTEISRVSSQIVYDSMIDVLLNCFYIMMEDAALKDKHKENLFLFEPEFDKKIGDVLKFHQIKENEKRGKNELKEKEDDFLLWLKKNNV